MLNTLEHMQDIIGPGKYLVQSVSVTTAPKIYFFFFKLKAREKKKRDCTLASYVGVCMYVYVLLVLLIASGLPVTCRRIETGRDRAFVTAAT